VDFSGELVLEHVKTFKGKDIFFYFETDSDSNDVGEDFESDPFFKFLLWGKDKEYLLFFTFPRCAHNSGTRCHSFRI